ncbi:MAG: S1C family serine protease [Actinomycetota bacterium]
MDEPSRMDQDPESSTDELDHIPLRDDDEEARTRRWYAAPLSEAPTTEIPPAVEQPEEPVEPPPGFWVKPEASPQVWSIWRIALAWFIAALLGAGIGAYAMNRSLGAGGDAGTVKIVKPPVENNTGVPDNQAARVAKVVLPSIVEVDVSGANGSGLGSGIIYRSDGYIITNDHVISGASVIQVNLSTGQKLSARVVGSAIDSGVDIAVLKVNATGLPAATFGTTQDLLVGDTAVAIGSPFGLQATVTAGVVSALHRDLRQFGIPFSDALQTDAPINPGNSGGALADSQGAVIGVNQAIVGGDTGGNVGVGFAIPVEWALKVADQLISTGRAQLAFLGISGDNLPGAKGAHVNSVAAGGPADRAGIKADDVIVSIGGADIDSMNTLIEVLLKKNVGDRVSVILLRGGKRMTVTVTLAARPTTTG